MNATLKKLKEQLTSFEDACKIENLDPEKVIPDFAFFPARDREAMIEHAKLVLIIKAANRIANGGEEWIPDYNDDNPKYEPWFEMGGSSGFRFNDYDHWSSGSLVGSRLCFFDDTTGDYVVETFIEKYRTYFC